MFGSRNKLQISDLRIGNAEVAPSHVVRNLGVYCDSGLNMEKHVNMLCRSCYLQFKNISRIRRFLTLEATKTLVVSLVMSKIDYSNAILYGISKRLLDRLQRIQNTGARIVTRTRRTQHITPVLKELHWLPVGYRIQFKILVLTWRALHDMAPPYIKDLLTLHIPARSLRSENKMMLKVPKSRTVTYGDRCFSKAAPVLWNSLPLTVRQADTLGSFKSRLKTYFFGLAF